MSVEEKRAELEEKVDLHVQSTRELDVIMDAADAYAREVLDAIHAAVCHPSAFAVAHGAKPTVHDIDAHAKLAEKHGIADEWVTVRKLIKGEGHA